MFHFRMAIFIIQVSVWEKGLGECLCGVCMYVNIFILYFGGFLRGEGKNDVWRKGKKVRLLLHQDAQDEYESPCQISVNNMSICSPWPWWLFF